jgi:citrate synthase
MSEPVNPAAAAEWWATSLTEILPGVIRFRGYPVEDLIGRAGFVDLIWLMLRGELPDAVPRALLEAALVASVDHGPQAPSIASARMAATTGVGINNAVANGINTLGDIHGGAGQQCMELYADVVARLETGTSPDEAVAAAVDQARSTNRVLPGFGHRFHRVDPRVAPLLALVEEASMHPEVDGRYVGIGTAVEAEVARVAARPTPMNIDGVTAVVFSALGFAPPLGRGLFVLSRAVGILAHAWEETQSPSRLKGPMPPSVLPAYTGPAPRPLPTDWPR